MKTRFITIVTFFMCSLTVFAQSNLPLLTQSLSSSGVIYRFNTQASLSLSGKISVSGVAQFSNNDSGYVRVLAVSRNGLERLLYQGYPLLSNDGIDKFHNQRDEDLDLVLFDPIEIRVDIKNATLSDIALSLGSLPTSSPVLKLNAQKRIVDRINQNLANQGELWRAGITALSQMSYEQKKLFFGGTVPDLNGAEYYAGGILDIRKTRLPNHAPSNYIRDFDWRNRHGANKESSPYFIDKESGWITSSKNQGLCGSCWAYAAVGALEAITRLYYNMKDDIDLSEQELVSCSEAGSCRGGMPGSALKYVKEKGLQDEMSFPYVAQDVGCDNKGMPGFSLTINGCEELWSIKNEDVLKSKLISSGPLAGIVWAWGHAMTLVGYKEIKEGDVIAIVTDNMDLTNAVVGDGSRFIGATAWIFKDSYWGTSWAPKFWYIIMDNKDALGTSSITLPVALSNKSISDINVFDHDGDGYYFWGIGSKPASAPSHIPDEPDGDDSDAAYGPMNEFGFLRALRPFDLYIKDIPQDKGVEPNKTQEPLWESPDIWIRNQNDAIEEHENPEYAAGKPVYIKVRIRNKGVKPSLPSLKLSVYWSQAGISLDRGSFLGQHKIGDLITGGRINQYTIPIPSIPAGGNVVISVPWKIEDPKLYEQYTKQPWHYCLLAEINGQDDPYHNVSAEPFAKYVSDNNNVAWKNLTIIETAANLNLDKPVSIGGAISLHNPTAIAQCYRVEIQEVKPKAVSLSAQAEVSVGIDPVIHKAWETHGSRVSNLEMSRDRLIATDDSATMAVCMMPGSMGVMDVKFNFLTKKLTEQDAFTYRVILKDANTDKTIGGETYVIRKKPRHIFNAEIQLPTKDFAAVYKAEDIGEAAQYTWMDESKQILGTGSELNLTEKARPEKLILEVVADRDGFKDYAELQTGSTTATKAKIKSLSPNPANNAVEVSFEAPEGEIELVLTSLSSGAGYTYSIPSGNRAYRIDLAAFDSGNYVLTLLVNKQVADTKMLSKN